MTGSTSAIRAARFFIVFLAMAAMFIFSMGYDLQAASGSKPKAVQQVTLSSSADFLEHSLAQEAPGHYKLKSGTYFVSSATESLSLQEAGISRLELGTGSTLRVGEEGRHAHTLLKLGELALNGGSLIAAGGNAEKACAVEAETFIMDGNSTILVSGGSASFAAGVMVRGNMLIAGNPKGTVLGGSGEESTGIMVLEGVSVNSDGDITFQGGSGNHSAGLLATREFSYAGKGKMTFVGGDGVASFGLATFRLILMPGSGSLLGMGGQGESAAGIMFAGSADIHGGIFMRSGSAAAAVAHIGKDGGGATFYADSVLTVDVDFSAPAGQEIGKMLVLGKAVSGGEPSGVRIEQGARLFFWVNDSQDADSPLERGGVFLSTPASGISGSFEMAIMDTISARKLSASSSLTGGKEYSLIVKRYPDQVID